MRAEREGEEEDVCMRSRSARDRTTQRRLYANAGREFDRGPTFPPREGVRTIPANTLPRPRAYLGLPGYPNRAVREREKGLEFVRRGNSLHVTQLIGARSARGKTRVPSAPSIFRFSRNQHRVYRHCKRKLSSN